MITAAGRLMLYKSHQFPRKIIDRCVGLLPILLEFPECVEVLIGAGCRGLSRNDLISTAWSNPAWTWSRRRHCQV